MFNFVFTLLFVCLDKMKDAIIAKLANQAADFYGDAFKQCQYKENLPKVRALALTRTHARMHIPSYTLLVCRALVWVVLCDMDIS